MERTPPFPNATLVAAVLPSPAADLTGAERLRLRDLLTLVQTRTRQLELELGAPLQLMTFDPGRGRRWLIGPASCNAAIPTPAPEVQLTLDRAGGLLITDAPTADGVIRAVSAIGSLGRMGDGVHPIRPCEGLDEAIVRVVEEVRDSWPAFELRALDWTAITLRHVARVRAAPDPVPALQAWLAELGDAHTWVHPAQRWGTLPYVVWIQRDAAVLVDVPAETEGWRAGARPGARLIGVDSREWWRRTAAPPYSRPLIAGYRFLSGQVGSHRELEARNPSGRRVRWSEVMPQWPFQEPVTWRRLPSGAGYLRIHRWFDGKPFLDAIDSALEALRGSPGLVVDLRGNSGGNVFSALRFRDRFLDRPRRMGMIRCRIPGGALAEPEPIQGQPARSSKRWNGPVRFLTDALTHSASEDAILGLQGLNHVEVIGEPSGGGSRRVRRLPLLPGWDLGVSTALTYDRNWRCVEASGIPVDRLVRRDPSARIGEDPVLAAADRAW